MQADRREILKLRFTALVFPVLCMLLLQATAQSTSGSEESLKKFLQNSEGNSTFGAERSTRYAAAFVDLKDDGKQEVIVYLIGPNWCGSGGCSALILAPLGESYKVITRTTVTQLPIRVLKEHRPISIPQNIDRS